MGRVVTQTRHMGRVVTQTRGRVFHYYHYYLFSLLFTVEKGFFLSHIYILLHK